MRHAIKYFAISALLAAGLASCNEDPVLPPVPEPGGGIATVGNGEWDKPINAFQAAQGYKSETLDEVWAMGYIVGWIDTDATPSHALNAESARFNTTGASQTNMLLCYELPWVVKEDAEGKPLFNEDGTPQFIPDEQGKPVLKWNVKRDALGTPMFDSEGYPVTELDPETGKLRVFGEDNFWEKCASVQLPSGNVRNALNLNQHPGNLGKQVTIKGESGSKYCGAYGIRSTSNYNWGAEGIYEAPQDPIPPVPAVKDGVTFQKVANVDGEGQYLLVFNGNLLTGPVEPSNYSYGWLPVATVTPEGDKIVTSTLNAYSFYSNESGWEIRDGYGRYVWWDSLPNHNSFQLTPKHGTEGRFWSVTPNPDGTVAITNIEMNVTIQYDAGHNNVGAFTNINSPLPALYKRVN